LLLVIDRNGTILYGYPIPEAWIGQSDASAPLIRAMLTQGQDTAELRVMDDIPRIYAFTALRGLAGAGYVSIGIPQAIAYGPARRTLSRNLICLGFVGVLALSAAWIGGDVFILRRVHALVRAAQRLSRGDLTTRTGLPHGPGELGQLARPSTTWWNRWKNISCISAFEEDLRRQNEALAEENRGSRKSTN